MTFLKLVINLRYAMARDVSHRSDIAETWESPTNPCEICGGQSGITPGLTSQYHSANASYSSSSSSCCLRKDKWTKPGNLANSSSFGNWGPLDRQVLLLYSELNLK